MYFDYRARRASPWAATLGRPYSRPDYFNKGEVLDGRTDGDGIKTATEWAEMLESGRFLFVGKVAYNSESN